MRSARSAHAAAQLPIVALTADAYADTRTRCLAVGMDDVLVKPLGLPELEALFQRHFGSDAGARGRTRARTGTRRRVPRCSTPRCSRAWSS